MGYHSPDDIALLAHGAKQLGIEVTPEAIETTLCYVDLLIHWNQRINLTAIKDRRQILHAHILDSWTLVPHLTDCHTLLDVGTGPGLPGIPVAIVCPSISVSLVESNGKKTAFLRQCKIDLALGNIHVIEDRVEQCSGDIKYDRIVSRAFSDLTQFVSGTSQLITPGGEWVAMKGMLPYDEIARVHEKVASLRTTQVKVPGLQVERHLVHMTPYSV